MSEVEYVRVNVNSAVAPPVLDSEGNTKGEVELQLPSNLISAADNVVRARMGVMKMQIPLGALPSTSAKVDSRYGPFSVRLKCKVIPCPWNVLQWENYSSIEEHGIFTVCRVIRAQNFIVSRNDISKYSDYEVEKGYHYFKNMKEFLDSFSEAICESIIANLTPESDLQLGDLRISFDLNTDNTISLNWGVLGYDGAFPAGFRDPTFYTDHRIKECFYYNPEYPNAVPVLAHEKEGGDFYIGVNYDVVQILPTLPWLKVPRPAEMPETQWDEPYIYCLDTRYANLSTHRDEYHIIRNTNTPALPVYVNYLASRYEFHFTESDAITNTDISAIVLTMSGADFSQQVYPVNYSVSNTSSALTTTVPIIEVYYPLWVKPSDKSTDLIVSKEDFNNAAPIVINPNLFKERVIKYKLHYINANGEMKEMLLPPGSPFQIQIVFELLKERATFAPMT